METVLAAVPSLTQVSPAGTRSVVSVGASPHTYTNSTARNQTIIVSAGTVTTIAISGDGGSNFDTVGIVAGAFPLRPNDRCRITYAVAPTVVVIGA